MIFALPGSVSGFSQDLEVMTFVQRKPWGPVSKELDMRSLMFEPFHPSFQDPLLEKRFPLNPSTDLARTGDIELSFYSRPQIPVGPGKKNHVVVGCVFCFASLESLNLFPLKSLHHPRYPYNSPNRHTCCFYSVG